MKRFWVGWFVFHFFLVVLVSSDETLRLLKGGLTLAPPGLLPVWNKLESLVEWPLGLRPGRLNPQRPVVLSYLNCAGIESGYGYFAPNVPDSARLVFELHYADGRVERDVPRVGSLSSGLRLTTLLEEMVQPDFDVVREPLVKLEAMPVLQDHPDATFIRALLGQTRLPSPEEFEQGERERFEELFVYDFVADSRPAIQK